MSHFIVGRIAATSSGECTVLAEHIIRLAENGGLTLRVIFDTNAKLQLDILEASGLARGSNFIFFDIIGPSETADELISPYVSIDEWPLSIKTSLDAISKLSNDLLFDHAVHEVSVVFSEGYDTSYESCEITAGSATNFLLKRFSDAGEVPSLTIKMEK